MSNGDRAMLAEAIKGKSDAEIATFAEAMGGEAFLDQTFDGMRNVLNPAKARDCIIGYRLSHAGGYYSYAVVIKDGVATIEKREPVDARVTLELSVPNYLRLITDQLPVVRSVLLRRLRIKGDRKFAREMQDMFRD